MCCRLGFPQGRLRCPDALAHFLQPCVLLPGRILRMPGVALDAYPPEMTSPSSLEGIQPLALQVSSSAGLNGALF